MKSKYLITIREPESTLIAMFPRQAGCTSAIRFDLSDLPQETLYELAARELHRQGIIALRAGGCAKLHEVLRRAGISV